jgi:hypothetical protein
MGSGGGELLSKLGGGDVHVAGGAVPLRGRERPDRGRRRRRRGGGGTEDGGRRASCRGGGFGEKPGGRRVEQLFGVDRRGTRVVTIAAEQQVTHARRTPRRRLMRNQQTVYRKRHGHDRRRPREVGN